MRKNLASHAEVAHYWANETQIEGQCGNMFFGGDLIYSYGRHFVAARRTYKEDGHGRRIVLVNAHKYSQSTTRHIGLICRAASHFRQITVPYPATDLPGAHKSNMEYLTGEVGSLVGKLKRSRTGIDYVAERVRIAVVDAATYHAVFAPDCPVRPLPLPDYFDAILAVARERERVFHLPPTDEVSKKRAAERERRRVQAEEKALVDQADAIARWRAGKTVYQLPDVPVMLRLSSEGGDVETSLQASVPVGHARRLFASIRRCHETGKGFQANGKSVAVGVYKVDSIGEDGTLHAGCHVIRWEEIERFAKSQGWEE